MHSRGARRRPGWRPRSAASCSWESRRAWQRRPATIRRSTRGSSRRTGGGTSTGLRSRSEGGGKFDDQHIFAPHVIRQDGEFWMYYSGSQRCVDAGTYKGKARDPAHPERSDQRLFKLGLAKSKDGKHFTRHSDEPVFSFGDDIHSVVTAAILKNPDGSVHREDGKLRMYFAAVDFPGGTYKHDLYETTSARRPPVGPGRRRSWRTPTPPVSSRRGTSTACGTPGSTGTPGIRTTPRAPTGLTGRSSGSRASSWTRSGR